MTWHHASGEISPYAEHFLGHNALGQISRRKSNPLAPGDTPRALAASETLRPWAEENGVGHWLDAFQKRQKLLGQRAGGTESMFPYKMRHELGEQKAASLVKKAITWMDAAKHKDCGCIVKQMKLMNQSDPVQAYMVDHTNHGGRIRWKVTQGGVMKETGKARKPYWAENDILDAYGRVAGGLQAEATRGPSRPRHRQVRDMVSASRPEFESLTDEDVPMRHHDAILNSEYPEFHEDPEYKPGSPKVYSLMTGNRMTFLAPVRHKETGETGWLRGRAEDDPASWRFYQRDDLDNAIRGRTPGGPPSRRSPQDGPTKADLRYVRQRATGKPAPGITEGDVELDEEGHQKTHRRPDPFEEFARQRGGWSTTGSTDKPWWVYAE